MAKPTDGTYQEDKRAQVKEHHRSVDCVVAGYAEHRNGGVGSLKLGLYDDAGEGPERRCTTWASAAPFSSPATHAVVSWPR
ncbi:MAG: hypothetical protein R2789_17980 [Microthrixaceae bacterium]